MRLGSTALAPWLSWPLGDHSFSDGAAVRPPRTVVDHTHADVLHTIESDAAACARVFGPFPVPVRMLDAPHLAAADYLRAQGVSVSVASHDGRMGEAARALGFPLAL